MKIKVELSDCLSFCDDLVSQLNGIDDILREGWENPESAVNGQTESIREQIKNFKALYFVLADGKDVPKTPQYLLDYQKMLDQKGLRYIPERNEAITVFKVRIYEFIKEKLAGKDYTLVKTENLKDYMEDFIYSGNTSGNPLCRQALTSEGLFPITISVIKDIEEEIKSFRIDNKQTELFS